MVDKHECKDLAEAMLAFDAKNQMTIENRGDGWYIYASDGITRGVRSPKFCPYCGDSL